MFWQILIQCKFMNNFRDPYFLRVRHLYLKTLKLTHPSSGNDWYYTSNKFSIFFFRCWPSLDSFIVITVGVLECFFTYSSFYFKLSLNKRKKFNTSTLHMILVCQYLYTVDGTGELYTMVAICHLYIFKNHQMF